MANKPNLSWDCSECGLNYDSEQGAKYCCSAEVSEITKWRCDECGKEHDYENEAIACCGKIMVTPRFECPVCDTVYLNTHDAEYCCATVAEFELHISHADMENAGQIRLDI